VVSKRPIPSRGTSGSNPSPSSGESANFRTLSGRRYPSRAQLLAPRAPIAMPFLPTDFIGYPTEGYAFGDRGGRVAPPAADPSQATGRVKRRDNQLHRARVLDVGHAMLP